MSAAAPALAVVRKRVAIRLADAGGLLACVSLAFAGLLAFFPVSFPQLLMVNWQNSRLTVALMAITLLLDAFLYTRVAILQSASPTIIEGMCVGSLPILVVGLLSMLAENAVAQAVSLDLPNVQAHIREEILIHTYLALVAGVFIPSLVLRFFQQFRDRAKATS